MWTNKRVFLFQGEMILQLSTQECGTYFPLDGLDIVLRNFLSHKHSKIYLYQICNHECCAFLFLIPLETLSFSRQVFLKQRYARKYYVHFCSVQVFCHPWIGYHYYEGGNSGCDHQVDRSDHAKQ